MSSSEVLQKYKGLINGKDWESGSLRRYKNGLTAICRKTNLFYVFEDSVSEYTGFKNALGEEIYEGDLLAVSDKNEKEIYIVYWDETCHQWKVGSSLFQDPLCNRLLESCLDSTLLGHIFTHQHLLISQREIVPERKIK